MDDLDARFDEVVFDEKVEQWAKKKASVYAALFRALRAEGLSEVTARELTCANIEAQAQYYGSQRS